MSNLEPIDDGVRRFRPGIMMLLCALLLAGGGWLIFQKVKGKQAPPVSGDEAKVPTVAGQIAEIREEPPPPPPPPSIHPLAGKRRLFLADGCRYRYHELTFAREFSEQHDYPGAVLRGGDPCLWHFVGVPEKEDVYRIYCADPNYPELYDKNLTYTRVLDDDIPQDDQAPYLTLRDDDLCEWKVRALPYKNQYELYCLSGSEPFAGESLGWIEDQDGLEEEMITATLGENGNPSWWILGADETPALPRRASHLIVMPRGRILNQDESEEDFEEHGHEIFRVKFETADDEFVRTAAGLNYVKLVKAIRDSDPVIEHEDFPPLASFDLTKLPGDESLFPLIIPLKVALHPHLILELTMENTEFWQNEWEQLEDFQSYLDESDIADGRVYRGNRFTYIFVSWDP
jgi:hypothetical protein